MVESRADQLESMWMQIYKPKIKITHSNVLDIRNKINKAITFWRSLTNNTAVKLQLQEQTEAIRELEKLSDLLKRVEKGEP